MMGLFTKFTPKTFPPCRCIRCGDVVEEHRNLHCNYCAAKTVIERHMHIVPANNPSDSSCATTREEE